MRHALNWFEIPVTDIGRAAAFYGAVLVVPPFPVDEPQPGRRMAFFPSEGDGVGGALVQSATAVPASTGTTVYLNVTGVLDAAADRVAAAGGSLLMPVTSIGPWGRIAVLRDPDGNVVGLHSAT